ncbi:MAG: hypothetical protein Q8M26_12435 [Pseudolabrys sp.]|nr:hypothetical protein [Pseudolabrys sp.]
MASDEKNDERPASDSEDQVDIALRALAMKQKADAEAPKPPETRTANEGMHPIPNKDIAPSGALNQEGHRPVLERSRKVR